MLYELGFEKIAVSTGWIGRMAATGERERIVKALKYVKSGKMRKAKRHYYNTQRRLNLLFNAKFGVRPVFDKERTKLQTEPLRQLLLENLR